MLNVVVSEVRTRIRTVAARVTIYYSDE